MRISRVWAMPNRWTFTIPPVKQLLSEFPIETEKWADPFAGYNSPALYTNDLDLSAKASSHVDALSFLKRFTTGFFDGVLYDPPYSITQARKYGSKEFSSMKYWANCKDEIARLVKPGGKVICFGWSSNGLGKGRGFRLDQVLLIAHGGSKNDTIITVETKV